METVIEEEVAGHSSQYKSTSRGGTTSVITPRDSDDFMTRSQKTGYAMSQFSEFEMRERQAQGKMDQKIKMLEMAPHNKNNRSTQNNLSERQKEKGITFKVKKRQNEMQEPFWPISNIKTVQSQYSGKAIQQISHKFRKEMDRIVSQMQESASNTRLGHEVLSE